MTILRTIELSDTYAGLLTNEPPEMSGRQPDGPRYLCRGPRAMEILSHKSNHNLHAVVHSGQVRHGEPDDFVRMLPDDGV